MLVLSLLSTLATSCEWTRETDVRCGYPVRWTAVYRANIRLGPFN